MGLALKAKLAAASIKKGKLSVPCDSVQRRRQNLIFRGNVQAAPKTDPALLKVLARPRQWFNDLASGRAVSLTAIAQRASLSPHSCRRKGVEEPQRR